MLQAGGRASTRVGNWGFALYGGTDLSNSFFHLREGGKRGWKLRAMAEYEWSESERILIDFGMAWASGTLNASVGMVDMSMDIRALRLAYESRNLRGRLYWLNAPSDVTFEAPLEFGGLTLATFIPMQINTHTVDGEVQWTLPEFTEKLLLMVGGGGRVTYIGSDQLLDGDTYSDITSPDYHKTGISHWEGRAGAFVHSEYKPAEWVTLSGSLRFDYNTVTPPFLSPRVVAVFKPAKGQYLRIGMSRAFRKSQFIETGLHPMVDFPSDSPITGPARESFQEFMSRSIGNPDLKNEELISFEAGYLGLYLDETLSVAMDIFFSQFRNGTGLFTDIIPDEQGLPDLENSIVRVANEYGDFDLYGSELVVRYNPSRKISLMASWAYRELFDRSSCLVPDSTPRNMFTIGGRFRTNTGLLGSLYIFSRSEFVHRWVENPEGIFAPALSREMDNVFLIMAKLGWKWRIEDTVDIETGLKLFLPFSPFSGPLFSYYEDAGGETPTGQPYGGESLRRVVSAYLQGSF
jgi:outer membrane receptor protein involved in Fe transport